MPFCISMPFPQHWGIDSCNRARETCVDHGSPRTLRLSRRSDSSFSSATFPLCRPLHDRWRLCLLCFADPRFQRPLVLVRPCSIENQQNKQLNKQQNKDMHCAGWLAHLACAVDTLRSLGTVTIRSRPMELTCSMQKINADSPELSWQQYRYRKSLLWGGILLYLPVVGSVGMILERLGLSAVAAAFAVVWTLLWAINGYRLSRFRCPTCEDYFFMKRTGQINIGNVWSTKCCHCGVRAPSSRMSD